MGTKKRTKRVTKRELRPAKERVAELLDKTIAKFEKNFADDPNPSLAEYLKLVQLKKELDEDTEAAKEIKVTWVEPEESENSH